MSLCKFANIFGEPGTGVHKTRVLGVAAVDLGLTVVLAVIFAWLLKMNVIFVFIVLMLLSLIVHRIFCVKTTLTVKVFDM